MIAPAVLMCFCLAFGLPPVLAAQARTTTGLRAGGGTNLNGKTAFVGQVDLAELSGSNSVEVAVQGFSGLQSITDYSTVRAGISHPHRDVLSVWGIGLSASYSFRHSLQTVGPYFLGGLGVGPLHVVWRRQSPTNPGLGTPMPGGGSFYEEELWTVGAMSILGLGKRLGERFDVRAQMLVVLVPSTAGREELELIRAFVLTTGVAF